MVEIIKNYTSVQAKLARLEKKYHRPPGSITMIGLTKGQPIRVVRQLAEEGLKQYGETKIEEALSKTPLKSLGLEPHFMGIIKPEKAGAVARNFNWVHTINSAKTAIKVCEERPDNLPPVNLLIEVKSGTNLHGFETEELLMIADFIERRLPRAKLRGLSATVKSNDLETRKNYCKQLKAAFDGLKQNGHPEIDTLCVHSSFDFEAAIAEGATMISTPLGKFGTDYFNDFYEQLKNKNDSAKRKFKSYQKRHSN